jgi:hypothetical protein
MSANPGSGPVIPPAGSADPPRWAIEPTRVLSLVLTERELIALVQTLADDDAQGALDFLREHLQGRLLRVLEGG